MKIPLKNTAYRAYLKVKAVAAAILSLLRGLLPLKRDNQKIPCSLCADQAAPLVVVRPSFRSSTMAHRSRMPVVDAAAWESFKKLLTSCASPAVMIDMYSHSDEIHISHIGGWFVRTRATHQ